MTLAFVLINLVVFSRGYAKNETKMITPSNNALLSTSEIIKKYTPEDSGIVAFGLDWSSELSYYSQRKSFSVPNWYSDYDSAWADPSSYLGNKQLGALVVCPNPPHQPDLQALLERTEVQSHPYVYQNDLCYLWMPNVQGTILTADNKRLVPIKSTNP